MAITSERPASVGPIVNADLFAAIEAAEELTRLPFDWDGEGGKAVTREHLDRVFRFLRTASDWARNTLHRQFPAPRIEPGPQDSIDLHWNHMGRELLLNVPADSSAAATFYGEAEHGDGEREKLRGTLGLEHENHWLAAWLLSAE
jgi:hypothetical protein